MKRLEFGQTFTILANVGIIAGIVLLAYELNQNRVLMRAETRNSIAQSISAMLSEQARDPEISGIYMRGRAGEQLTPLEAEQFGFQVIAWLRIWENQHYQYRQGLYDESEYLAVQELWLRSLREGGMREQWCQQRQVLAKPFFDEVNALLGESRCR